MAHPRYWPSEIITKKQIKEDLITQQKSGVSENTGNKSDKNAAFKTDVENEKKQICIDMPSIFEQQEPTEKNYQPN